NHLRGGVRELVSVRVVIPIGPVGAGDIDPVVVAARVAVRKRERPIRLVVVGIVVRPARCAFSICPYVVGRAIGLGIRVIVAIGRIRRGQRKGGRQDSVERRAPGWGGGKK